MFVKACILDGDESILQHQRDFFDRNHDAVFGAFVIGDQVALTVIDKGSLILRIQRSQIQRGRGIDIGLCDTDQRTGQREADA